MADLNTTSNQLDKIAGKVEKFKQELSGLTDSASKMDKVTSIFHELNTELDNLQRSGKAGDEIAHLEAQMNNLISTYGQLNRAFKSGNTDGLDFSKFISSAQSFESTLVKITSSIVATESKISSINVAVNTATAEERLTTLSKKVEELYGDLERLNDLTRNTDWSNGGMDVKEYESFRKELEKVEKFNEKINEAQFGNIDTTKVAELEKEYEAINNSTMQIKMNEAIAQNGLKVYIDYAKELRTYINDIVKLMASGDINPANLGEHLTRNTGSLRPYGISVRGVKDEDRQIYDNENRVILKGSVLELDEDKLKEVGEEYASAVKEFMNFLIKFKSLTNEMSNTSALNSISPRRFLTANGEISDEFKGILGIAGKNDSGFDEDVTTKNVSYTVGGETVSRKIKQMQLPDDPSLGLYEKTNTERLEGFTDEKGEHLGYKGLTKELEEVVNKVVASLAKLANFTPGLASTDTVSGMDPMHGIGYTGTDLAKRLSYGSWLNESTNFDENGGYAEAKDVPITALKSFSELGSTAEEVRGKLSEMGKSLPSSGNRDYRHDPLEGRRLGDLDEVDSYGNTISNTSYLDYEAQNMAVKYSANISDNMSEAEKAAAEAAANFKSMVAQQATKTGLIKEIVDDNEPRALDQHVFAGGATQAAYKSSGTKSGAVDYWGQARDQVKEIENKQKDVELAYKQLEDIFKSGDLSKLLQPINEFDNSKPIEALNNELTQMMKLVQAFDKGSYARSASTPGKDGTVLFDRSKYLEFADKIGEMTKALLSNESFQSYGATTESLSEISQNIEAVTKSVETGRKSEAGNKLNAEYLKNALKESILTKELEAREQNLTSGLLAGSDLTAAQKKIEQVRIELEGARQAMESVNKEAEKNSISLEAATNKAEILKEVYWEVAGSLGSTNDADTFFKKVNSLSQITGDNLRGIADGFGDRLANVDMSYLADQLKNVKNDLGLLSGGGYERSLSSSIVSSKGLSKAEQEVARYQNEAIREQLNNAKLAMTGSYEALENAGNNIGANELRQSIDSMRQSIASTSNKIAEIMAGNVSTDIKAKLINYEDRLGKVSLEFDKLQRDLSDSSSIGQLRTVFENSKTLGQSLSTLNKQVDLVAESMVKPLKSDVTSELVKGITDKERKPVKFSIADDKEASKLLSEIINKAKLTHTAFNNMSKQSSTEEIAEDFKVLASRVGEVLYEAPMLYQELNGIGESREGIEQVYKNIAKLASRMQETIAISKELGSGFSGVVTASSLIDDKGIRNTNSSLRELFEEALNYKKNMQLLTGKEPTPDEMTAYYDNVLSKFKPESDEYQILNTKKLAEQEVKRKQILEDINKTLEEYRLGLSSIVSQEELLNSIKEKSKSLGTDNSEGKAALKIQQDLQKSIEDTAKARDKEKQDLASEMYNAKFNNAKNYVADQEALTGQKMPLQAQLEYYKSAIKQFDAESNEYIAILKLQRNVEKQIAEQAAAEKQAALDNEIKIAEAKVKAEEDAAKAQQEAIKRLLEETKNYVSTQEALNNKPMSYEAQAEYYKNQLPKFVEGTREYIEVLKLKNQAEAKAAEAAERAAEEEKKAHQEALEAARSKVQGILNTVKSLADGINRAVNKIVQIIRTGISLVNRVISAAGKIINTLASGVQSIITLFGSLSNRVRQIFGNTDKSVNGLTGSMNLLKGSATELRSKIMLLKGAFNTVFNNQIINKGKNLLTAIATMNVVMGAELTNNTIKWAQELERALGISATDLIADLKEISAVLYGLGMSSEDTALGAQNLGMMSRYLGMMGLAGGNVDQVMTKLASGMKGMTQAIDDLGLSVRDSQMQSFIKGLKNGTSELSKALREQGVDLSNMGDDFSALNEQARVYIRYAALIEQFKSNYDLSDFAKQLNTVTGRLSILSQTWSSLATGIGVEFAKVGAIIAGYLIPIIKRLQVYLLGTVQVVNGVEVQIEGLVHRIQALINKIGSFFGIDIGIKLGESLHAGLNNLNNADTSGIEDTNKTLEETGEKLDEISEKSKKAGGNLQSFDRISNSTKSSSEDSGADDFDYSVLMNSALDSLKAYTDTADSYFDILDKNLTDTVTKIKEKLKEVADALTGRKLDFGFDNEATKENLNKTWQEIKKLVTSWGGFVIKIGLKIADDVNIGAIITKISELLAKITEVANIISEVLQPALDIFYETGIKPIMEYLGVETLNIIDWLIEKLDELAEWFTSNKDTIYTFFEDLGNKVAQVFRILTGQQNLDDVIAINTNESGWGTFLRIIDSIPERLSKAIGIIKELVSVITGAPSLDAVITMNSGTDWGNILSIISSLRDILGQLLDKLGDFVTNEGLPWLQEQLAKLADWIKTNKDKIVELVDKLAGIAWEAFKVFVDLVGKLIDYVVNNPDSVLNFFTALLGLKVASWFTSVAASIGLALTGMKGFTGLLGKIGGGAAAAGTGAAAGGAAAGTGAAAGGAAAGGAAAAGGVALGPILAVIAAVVALIASVKDLWDTSERFRDSIKAVWDKIVEAFNNAKEKIGEAFSNIKEAWDNFYKAYDNSFFKDLIAGLVSLLANYLGGAIASLIDLVGNLFATIGNLLADVINIVAGVFDVLGGLWKLISGIFTLDGDRIKEGWGQVCTGLVEIVTGLFQGIVDIAGGIVGAIIDAGSAIVGGLGQGISDAWQGFVEWVRGLFDSWITSVKEFFGIHSPSTLFAEIGSFLVSGLFEGIKAAWEGFKNGVTELCSSLVDTIKGIFSGIGSFFSDTFQKAKEAATNAWSDAKDKFNGIKDNIVSNFNDVKDTVGAKFSEAKEAATNAWSDAKAVFTGVADKVADGFNTVKDKVKGTFSELKTSVASTFNDIKDKASSIWDKIKTGVSDFGTTVYTTVTGKTKATKGNPITTNANGGSIAGGELFIANEHGEPELMGKIDKTGRTNVANNGMIIDAMRSGVFEAVYNAMAEVHNQTAGRGTGGVNKLEINGFGLIDPSTVRELARLLAPYFNSNNINIADTEFSIN